MDTDGRDDGDGLGLEPTRGGDGLLGWIDGGTWCKTGGDLGAGADGGTDSESLISPSSLVWSSSTSIGT